MDCMSTQDIAVFFFQDVINVLRIPFPSAHLACGVKGARATKKSGSLAQRFHDVDDDWPAGDTRLSTSVATCCHEDSKQGRSETAGRLFRDFRRQFAPIPETPDSRRGDCPMRPRDPHQPQVRGYDRISATDWPGIDSRCRMWLVHADPCACLAAEHSSSH
ncbi:hypothetical protein VTN96DRAFT_7177 [Rasamsonia emersonii]